MTVNDFYMKIGTMFRETHVEIIAAKDEMKTEFDVALPDFKDALSDISDYLFDWIKEQIEPRARNAEDDENITPGELAAFLKVLEVIEW